MAHPDDESSDGGKTLLRRVGSDIKGFSPPHPAPLDIFVENLSTSPVTFTKRAAAANPQGTLIGPVSPTVIETLGPLQALQINCQNIADLFGSQQTEGFAIIDSPTGNLQVTSIHRSLNAKIYWYMAIDDNHLDPGARIASVLRQSDNSAYPAAGRI